MAKKPCLTENAKRIRVEIAEDNIQFDNRIWGRTIFLDEFSYETGPKGQFRVRRTVGTRDNPENVLLVPNSGWSSVMCCACFSRAGIGPIVRSNGNFNSEQYINFLENRVIPYAEECFPDSDYYILHDNSRIHTSYESLAYLTIRFGADRVIRHPPYSPDLNPIENLFGIMSKKIKDNRHIFKTQELLWLEIQKQWQELGLEISTIHALVDSTPNRYWEVLEKNGSNTHY